MNRKDSYRDIMYLEGPPKNRPGMDVGHRAKQFAPFDALRGFGKGLRNAEREAEEAAAEEVCMREEEYPEEEA